jgi:peptide chain release factor 1
MLEKLRRLATRFEEIEALLATPEVAADPARARALHRERGQLQHKVELFRAYEQACAARRGAEEILALDPEPEMHALARQERDEAAAKATSLEADLMRALVDDEPTDAKDAIVEIRAGVGGDEASLFAADLFRMYSKWADRAGYRIEVLASSESEVGGLKEIVFAVAGPSAFGRLHYESGGHRIQRVPETETQGRIHTSIATVAVLPEAEEVEVEVREEDLRVDTFRSGGPGGQNVNKTSSAVRLTHLPSGLVVVCQDESSQHKNRAKAMRVLRARLFEIEDRKRRESRDANRKSQVGSGDRSERVRTYNVPQNRVTDHRLKENYNFERVVEGDLDELLERLKRLDVDERLKATLSR